MRKDGLPVRERRRAERKDERLVRNRWRNTEEGWTASEGEEEK